MYEKICLHSMVKKFYFPVILKVFKKNPYKIAPVMDFFKDE